ncbi:cupredoxin domain-containing protein [Fodinicola acaciae]|uniref:cupredoxin domain-containing protein n=1 Tax=Fodinicola acaciae TaxID=2681555 RepID=UPI001C9E2847|nr:cupredoxin family copper-binding protein [Fodinicola acaciae]
MRITAIGVACAAGGVSLGLLAGCGSTAPAAPAGASQPMPGMSMPAPSATQNAAPVATNTVSIKNFAFVPATITVKAGVTVTWTNADQDAHTVTSVPPASQLRSPTLNTGGVYRHAFTAPGTYQYLCTIHPFMTGTVVVTR